jgi:hypothetical protein
LRPVETGLLSLILVYFTEVDNNQTRQSYSTMPITTRTVAKGIPPRLHEPKLTHKLKKGKGNKKPSTKGSNKKRAAASDSEEDEEEEPIPDDSVSKGGKRKGNNKRRRKVQEEESNSSEAEVVSDRASEPPEVIVDDRVTTPPLSDEQEVGTWYVSRSSDTHHMLG